MEGLRPGSWYRVAGRVDPALVARLRLQLPGRSQKALTRLLTAEVGQRGLYPTVLAYQDPSDPYLWSFVARAQSSSVPDQAGPLTFVGAVEVEEPPIVRARPMPPPTLDAFIPYDEALAVGYALGRENDPKHLKAFGDTLLPDWPVAFALVNARRELLESSREPGARERAVILEGLDDLVAAVGGLGRTAEAAWRPLLVAGARGPGAMRSGALVWNPGIAVEVAQARAQDPPLDQDKTLRRLRKLVCIAVVRGEVPAKAPWRDWVTTLVRVLPNGVRLVRPEIARVVFATPPERVSPSAVTLVCAISRPGRTVVSDSDVADRRLAQIKREASRGDPDGKAALREVKKAEKLVLRRKWVEQYARLLEGTHDGHPMVTGRLTGR